MFQQESKTEVAAGRFDWLSVAFLLGGVLLLYYLVPLVSLLTSQPLGEVLARSSTPTVRSAVWTSLTGSATSTAIATVFGLPLAYWLARRDGRVASVVTAIVVLPLVLPPVASGLILLTLVGPGTALGELAAVGGFSLTGSLAGVVLAQTFVASPFVVVTAKAAFESVDRSLEHASRSLGKTRLTTVRRVTLPLAWPGIVAGMTLAFARAMGEFGATIMLAYYPRTMPVEIWVSFSSLGIEYAFPIAIILVAVSVAALIVLNLLRNNPLE